MLFSNSLKTTLLLTLFISLLLAACGNPAGSDDEEHPHAEGAILLLNGEEVVRYSDGQVTGSLEVDSGEETPLISIYFLDEEGERFLPEESGISLNWEEIDTSIAEIQQHDEDGKWSFHLVGVSTGETEVEFHMWHDGEDHSDFFTPGIPITVN